MTSYALEVVGSKVGWVLRGSGIYPGIGRSIMVGRSVINFDSSGVGHNNFRFKSVTKARGGLQVRKEGVSTA